MGRGNDKWEVWERQRQMGINNEGQRRMGRGNNTGINNKRAIEYGERQQQMGSMGRDNDKWGEAMTNGRGNYKW